MEITVPKVKYTPGEIEANFESLNRQMDEYLKKYTGIVYQDDQINLAKEDIKNLRSVRNAIDDRRKEIKRTYDEPLKQFESMVKEVTGKADKVISEIDTQIKVAEEKEDAVKKQRIQDYWNANGYSAVSLDRIWNERWLNHTYSDRQWQADLDVWKSKINGDTLTISNITDHAQNQFLMAAYMQSLDLGKCMAAWQDRVDAERRAEELRIAQEAEKKAAEAKRAEEAQLHSGAQEAPQASQQPAAKQESVPQPEMYFAEFRVEGTWDQMVALNNAIKSIGISMHVLKKGRM